MKCTNCGMEVEEGSLFCENCGSRIEMEAGEMDDAAVVNPEPEEIREEVAPEMEMPAATVEKNVIFCPNCGKRFEEGEVFCDECGTNLLGDVSVVPSVAEYAEESDAKKKMPKVLIPIAAGVVVVGLAAFAAVSLFGGKSTDKIPTKIVYLQDEVLQLIDLKNKKAEGKEITDSFLDGRDGIYPVLGSDFISKDGKYLFYMEDYDGNTYDLYKAKISKPGEGEKLESKVQFHTILDDNTVLFMKKGSFYHYDGKETRKFGKDVDRSSYKVSEDLKSLQWGEYDSDSYTYTYYYQDLAQKKDKVKLLDDVSSFYSNKTLTKFYALKGDDVYALDREGNKEKVAKKVVYIPSINVEEGEFYYLKYNPVEMSGEELVYDDTQSMSSYDQEWINEKVYEFPVYELYHYGKDGDQLISENVNYDRYGVWSGSGKYCMYYEYPVLEDLKVNWSDIDNTSWSSAVQKELEDEVVAKLVSGTKQIGEFEDVEFRSQRYSSKAEKLYAYSEDTEEEEGIIYEIALSGNNAGQLKEFDSDAYRCRIQAVTEKGLYYIKDYDEYGGDLYFNGNEIASDVYQIQMVDGDGLSMYASDYDSGESSYSISLRKGGKDIDVADDVNYGECADDGTMVLLVDYDQRRHEGELMYYDGKDVRLLADDVAAFAPRKGSTTIN